MRTRRWASTAAAATLGLALAPLEAQTFTDVAATAGVARFSTVVSAAAWGDYDNDGWLDLFACGTLLGLDPGLNRLFHNNGDGTFTEVMADSSGYGGGAWADYDNDGNLDLVALTNLKSALARLYHNDGDGSFTDQSRSAGVSTAGRTVAWADYDGDGHVDLYVARAARNLLYRNLGDGTFTDRGESAGLDDPGTSWSAAWGDFDDDGDQDLLVGNDADIGTGNSITGGRPHQLYENQGDGTFGPVDPTAGVTYLAVGWGAAWADYDGDGDLDFFDSLQLSLSRLFRNEGNGTFHEVGPPAGISVENGQVAWLDADSDGHLDLFVTDAGHLYRSRGDGTFAEVTQTAGISGSTNGVAAADYDNDGDVDLFAGAASTVSRLYRNDSTGAHWLQVELVGTRSNRSAIGACAIAVADGARQRRDVDGGSGGWSQPSLPLEFGLGNAARVDSLIVRWPSGRVDALAAVPADQRIRLIEGQPGYQEARATVWTQPPPAALRAGTAVPLAIGVRPALFEAGARITRVEADLSPFGGSAALPLVDRGDGTFALQASLRAGDTVQRLILGVTVEQQTSLGPYRTHLSRVVGVMPAQDLAVLGGPVPWRTEVRGGAEVPSAGSFAGRDADAFKVAPASFIGWAVTLRPTEPVDPMGYALRFAFHPGTAAGPTRPQLNLRLNTSQVYRLFDGASVRRVDLGQADWQEVEVSLDSFALAFDQADRVESLAVEGNLTGTFYLSDLRLATLAPGAVATAVTEQAGASRPSAFALEQNYPNPFNSDTAIRFSLAERAEVELSLYDLAGQRVATLARGWREPGTYTLRWDGRDDQGRPLASGVYLYQLHAGNRETARRLLLLR